MCFNVLHAQWIFLSFHHDAFVSKLLSVRTAAAYRFTSLDAQLLLGFLDEGEFQPHNGESMMGTGEVSASHPYQRRTSVISGTFDAPCPMFPCLARRLSAEKEARRTLNCWSAARSNPNDSVGSCEGTRSALRFTRLPGHRLV